MGLIRIKVAPATLAGGGMILQDQILPSLYQLQRGSAGSR